MLELYEKLDELKKLLNSLPVFIEIDDLLNKIYSNPDLVEKLTKYHESKDISLRDELLHNPLIAKYKLFENEVNFLILQINQKLNSISGRGGLCE